MRTFLGRWQPQGRRPSGGGWQGHALSSVGGRTGNQDQARVQLLDPADSLWGCSVLAAVADGMGGHEHGAQASHTAVDTVWEVLAARPGDREEFAPAWLAAPLPELVARTIRLANGRIHTPAADSLGGRSMGTTLTLLVARGEEVVIGHVGDSRAYVWAGGALRQVTTDHTFVAEALAEGTMTAEEAADSPFVGQLTRGVGLRPEVVPDTFALPDAGALTVLLCSDGLTGVLSDEDIAAAMGEHGSMDALARALIALAEGRDPTDNISVVCLRRQA